MLKETTLDIMLTTELKENTKKEHASLEKKLISVLKDIKSSEDYLNVLQVFYAYYSGLENRINRILDRDLLPDVHHRRKAEYLLNDIRHFDANPSLAESYDLPEINSPYAALGSLYVMEGSTLGGQIISKMIMQKLGSSGEGGLSFFQGYGTDTHEMWEKFKSILDNLTLLPDQREELVTAARETFVRFEALFNRKYEKLAAFES